MRRDVVLMILAAGVIFGAGVLAGAMGAGGSGLDLIFWVPH